jgi:DNA-binding MarR family transcriptional regulator
MVTRTVARAPSLPQQWLPLLDSLPAVGDGRGASERAAWRALLRAHAAVVEALERALATRDLSVPFYDVLDRLDEAGGRLRMRELADAVMLSRSGLTRLIDRMQRAGYVRREQCADDRRGAYATITTTGRRALRQAAPVHARGVDEHFSRHVTQEESVVLTNALERVAKSQPRS